MGVVNDWKSEPGTRGVEAAQVLQGAPSTGGCEQGLKE